MKDYPKVVFLYITEEDEFTGLNNVVAVFPERRRQDDIEYIRADIHEDEIAKLKAALIEVRDSARSCVPMNAMSTPEQMAMKLTKFARIVNEALEATND